MNADQLVRPGQRIGKYILGEPIARGGMAEVWSARVEGPEGFVKPVALKFVLESFRGDPELERLFVNEARVAAQLQHANLVSVFDFDKIPDGEDGVGGRYYIAMERVDGFDLRRVGQDAHRRGQQVPPAVMLHIAGEVLKGLRHVHERRNPQTHRPLGLVHRDVSPHNILIGMGGEVKLSDFGIAKAMAQSFGTQSGLIRGKLAYASPEQLRNEPLDHRTDQFAVGVTLWEGLAGRRLFDGCDAREIITKVNDGVVPALAKDIGVDARVEAIVRRMLAADANARFASTAEALSAVLAAPGYTADGAPLAALMSALFAPSARDVPPTLTLPRRPEKALGVAHQSPSLAAIGLAETKTLERGPDVPVPAPEERETANDRVGRARLDRSRAGKATRVDRARGRRGTGVSATRAVPVVRKRDPGTVTGSSYVSGAFPDDILRLVRARPSHRMMLVIGGLGVALVAGIGALVWQGSREGDSPMPDAAPTAGRQPAAHAPPMAEPARPERHDPMPADEPRPSAPTGSTALPVAATGEPPSVGRSAGGGDIVERLPEPSTASAPIPTSAVTPTASPEDGKHRRVPRGGRHDDSSHGVFQPTATTGNEVASHGSIDQGSEPATVNPPSPYPAPAKPSIAPGPEKVLAPPRTTGSANPNGAPVLQ